MDGNGDRFNNGGVQKKRRCGSISGIGAGGNGHTVESDTSGSEVEIISDSESSDELPANADPISGREVSNRTKSASGSVSVDKRRYCICNQFDDGSKMIACDNPQCKMKWFHFACVKITASPRGKWYCPDCRGDHPNCALRVHVPLPPLQKRKLPPETASSSTGQPETATLITQQSKTKQSKRFHLFLKFYYLLTFD